MSISTARTTVPRPFTCPMIGSERDGCLGEIVPARCPVILVIGLVKHVVHCK